MTISEYLKKKEKLNEERIQLEEKLRKNSRKSWELIQALHRGNKSEYMKNLKGSKIIEPEGDVIEFEKLKTEKLEKSMRAPQMARQITKSLLCTTRGRAKTARIDSQNVEWIWMFIWSINSTGKEN